MRSIRFRRTRDTWCPSELRLDRHLAGELDEAARRSVDAHLAGCDPCRARVAARQGDEELPPMRLPPGRRHAMWGMAALLAAAALLLVVRPGDAPRAPVTRPKGGDRVGLYVQHAGLLRAGGPHEIVYPGDTIQLTTTLTAKRWVAAVSVDGAGAVSIYHGDDPAAGWQPPGEDVPLPTSVGLDATLGREAIHLLLCREPIELGPVVKALRADPVALPAHAGCELETVWLDKRERP